MRTINFISNHRRRKILALETLKVYAPLAERIGMQELKSELQDICFNILNPDIRRLIIQLIEYEQDKLILQIIDELRKILKLWGVRAKVFGRQKTPYSTWMKMQQKNVTVEQLSDLLAFRIIVDNIENCYKTLYIIHANYKVMHDTFQDFIIAPKDNGYQSIHTVVIGPSLRRVEIQIRTYKMHNIAELGLAAHWRYKQRYDNNLGIKQYIWFKKLLSVLERTNIMQLPLNLCNIIKYFTFIRKENIYFY